MKKIDQNTDITKVLGVGKHKPRGSWLKRIIFLIILTMLIGGGAKWWVSSKENSAVKYNTVPVHRGDLVVTVSATGTLEPIKEVEVGIEVSGTIKSVDVDYNDKVEVGQVLARIDTSKLEAQALQSTAALESARAKLLQTEATVKEADAQMARLEEVRKLSDGKMPSQNEFDAQKAVQSRARADQASAKAAVSQAQATLDANKSDLQKAVVHSPINGVVLERSVEPGQTLAATFQSPVLFTLAEDLTKMELMIDVDEADVGQVAAEQNATFTVDAYPDRVFPAQVTQVRYGSETVDGVVTYKAVLKVDNASMELRPGMTATALITVNKRQNAILIPNAALRFAPPQEPTVKANKGNSSLLGSIMPHPPASESIKREDLSAKKKEQLVWTVREGVLTSIPIKKGLSDGKMTEVSEGAVEAGMELVTDMVTSK
jgi:HlyD family secretion protein